MRKIKYLVMDVDGTLTDGKIYVGNSGECVKVFNVKDGYGINKILPELGITPIIITGRKSRLLEFRCKELGVTELYQSVDDKIDVLLKIFKYEDLSNVAYIGDDLNDYQCMTIIQKNGGLVGCPLDASKKIISISNYVSSQKGGEGAVRDFIEWLQIV